MKAIYILLIIIILYNAYINSVSREGLGMGTAAVASGIGGGKLNPWSDQWKLPNLIALPWNFACEWNKTKGTLDCPERKDNWDESSLANDGPVTGDGVEFDTYSSAFHALAVKADNKNSQLSNAGGFS